MSDNEDLSRNLNKLLAILKKMMAQQGAQGKNLPPEIQQLFSDPKNIQLNLCFFSFLPVSPDALDELEDALQESLVPHQEEEGEEDLLNFEITASDVDFLKKNGIKF
jgi:hypothetical protein